MRITVIGVGYVGLVAAACFAEAGHEVVCLDNDPSKVDFLNAGRIPIHEPGLERCVVAGRERGRLRFTVDFAEAIAHAEILFIAVGTPSGADGGTDTSQILAVADEIGRRLAHPALIVTKSTAPVGTAEIVERRIAEALLRRGADIRFAVASNPEFLREGSALDDFRRPDRVIVGADEPWAIETLSDLHRPFLRDPADLLVMDRRSAELTKYAANAMLAARISFMNELANLAASLDADIDAVRRGVGGDPRIGPHFLSPGPGYGGSCLPKDVGALIRMGELSGVDLDMARATRSANDRQKRSVSGMVRRFYASRGGLAGRTIAVWGLAFKANTDDIRESPSLDVIDDLLAGGASIRAYDPVATAKARAVLGERERLRFCETAADALSGSDSLAVLTEWDEFRAADPATIAAALRDRAIFDGRRLYDAGVLRAHGLRYEAVGGPSPERAASNATSPNRPRK